MTLRASCCSLNLMLENAIKALLIYGPLLELFALSCCPDHAMLWFPCILPLLFGVIACGNHLMDNRLRNAVTMTSAMTRSQDSAEHSAGRDTNLYRALTVYNEDKGDFSLSENEKNIKKNFPNSNDLTHSTILSDIMGLDAPSDIMHFSSMSNDNVGGSIKVDTIAETPFPASYFDEYNEDVSNTVNARDEIEKRTGSPPIGCDCKLNNDLLDLGQQHFPRYLLNAVCQTDAANEYPPKCRRGTHCKPLEYKVKVLTFRNMLDHGQNDPALAWLPDDLRQLWKFKTVTVAAGCFCSY